jgi:uncharacterized protein
MPGALGGAWTELLVLQPTAFCNIDCTYCYLPARNDRRRMSSDVLEAIFRAVLRSRFVLDTLTVVWHAGEPLVLPPDWYGSAFAIAERYRPAGLRLRHSFQSNGLLLDALWVDFLSRSGAEIGLSIDGPSHLHDARRRTRSGAGTHTRAMRGLSLLREADLPFHVISVLTAGSLEQPDALFDFYVANGIRRVAFNVEETEGINTRSSLAGRSQEARFRDFLRRFFARMQAEPGAIVLREWERAVAVIRARGIAPAGQETEPMRIVSVDVSGNVSSFSPEFLGMRHEQYGDFSFGNVLSEDIDTIAGRVLASSLASDIHTGVAACECSCAWFRYCGGGSPSNKLFENGSVASTETMFCRLVQQALLDVVLETIESGEATA